MFKLNPQGRYMMPAHFGERPRSPRSSGWYRDVTSMVVPFRTDRDRLAACLPRISPVLASTSLPALKNKAPSRSSLRLPMRRVQV